MTGGDIIEDGGKAGDEENGRGDDNGDIPPPKIPPKARRQLPVGSKEDVFSLDEGAVIVQWPERIYGVTEDDITNWLKLVETKIKRAVDTKGVGGGDDESGDE
jgi:hypothetical protein